MSTRLRLAVSGLAVCLAAVGSEPAAQGPVSPPMGAIRGRVEVRRIPPTVERRPTVGALGRPDLRQIPDRTRSVVYLETAPGGAFEELGHPRATLDQRNESFVPFVLAITVGTTVDFLNSDRTYHNVFSLSRPKRFDLGRYPTGHSKSIRFDRPGIVRVFCDIHSHMSAFILVFSHRYFAVTDGDGRYQIGRVPAGTYTVMSWNDGEVRESQAVVVPPDGGTVEADFTIR